MNYIVHDYATLKDNLAISKDNFAMLKDNSVILRVRFSILEDSVAILRGDFAISKYNFPLLKFNFAILNDAAARTVKLYKQTCYPKMVSANVSLAQLSWALGWRNIRPTRQNLRRDIIDLLRNIMTS